MSGVLAAVALLTNSVRILVGSTVLDVAGLIFQPDVDRVFAVGGNSGGRRSEVGARRIRSSRSGRAAHRRPAAAAALRPYWSPRSAPRSESSIHVDRSCSSPGRMPGGPRSSIECSSASSAARATSGGPSSTGRRCSDAGLPKLRTYSSKPAGTQVIKACSSSALVTSMVCGTPGGPSA